MVTEARLAVVDRHLLAGIHTGVGVSEGEVDVGVLVAVLALSAEPRGLPRLHDSLMVSTTDASLWSH